VSEPGPLERIVQGVVANLSEEPEAARLAIRSRRGLVLDGMASVSNRETSMLERWTVLADWFFQLTLQMLADVSEVADEDRLLFEEVAGALEVAQKVDEASSALMERDERRFLAATGHVERTLGLS
jgi:hypothetical protein